MSKSEYESKTIKEVIISIRDRKMFLPAIQRNFVWKDEQIIRLFDSIMRGYPIGTFLFWEIDKETLNQKEYTLYEFLHDYDERAASQNESVPKPYIPNNGESSRDTFVIAVLDGQQRLTSLYLTLQGTIIRKGRGRQSKTKEEKELYFNLHSNPINEEETDDDTSMYEFKFFSKAEFEEINTPDECPSVEHELWFKVKDILQYNEPSKVGKVARENKPRFDDDDLAIDNLRLLHDRLVSDSVINYFNAKANHEVENEKFTTIDEVTDIFVRINSGGTKLTKTDLLFSRIVSVWDNARKEFQILLKDLNDGEEYKFDNNFILKACLMTLKNAGSRIKAESLSKKNIEQIKDCWNRIKDSIMDVRKLLNEYGIVQKGITSYNALLPLVLFRYLFGVDSLTKKNVLEMRKYVIISQINELFGKSSNTTLDRLRSQIFKLEKPIFPDIRDFRFDKDKVISLDRNIIRAWFDFEKGPSTFIILTLLYPSLKYDKKLFDQDHMHPISSVDEKTKQKLNKLANLQMLERGENAKKGKDPLKKWLSKYEEEIKYLPTDCSYELDDFEEFMQKRQKLMEDELCRIFGVK